MKVVKLVFALMLVLGVLAGCGESTVEQVNQDAPQENSTDSENQQSNEEQTSEETAPAAPEIFGVGDTVKFDDLQITFNGVRVATSDLFEPQNGKFVVLDLTIENTGTEPAAISTMLQMSLQDAEAYTYDIALFTETKGSLDGEVGPGRKMRGEIAFDVPDSASYQFIFEDPFTTGQAIWEFTAQ